MLQILICFFFFKQKTAYEMCGRDWSSDVCSSDLAARIQAALEAYEAGQQALQNNDWEAYGQAQQELETLLNQLNDGR